MLNRVSLFDAFLRLHKTQQSGSYQASGHAVILFFLRHAYMKLVCNLIVFVLAELQIHLLHNLCRQVLL